MSLEQLKKREKSLEAEVKRLTEELAEALKLIKELQGKERMKNILIIHTAHFDFSLIYTLFYIVLVLCLCLCSNSVSDTFPVLSSLML